MRTVAIVPARFESSRLPGKAMLPIEGEPMLGRLLERVARSESIDDMVVATTTLESDDALVATAKRFGARWFRGSENDVLGRIVGAAKEAETDLIVEVMGDSPLVHADLVDETVAFLHAEGCDFACSYTDTVKLPDHDGRYEEFPVGIWVEVFPTEVMERCERECKDAYAREHSTSGMYRDPDNFSLRYLEATGKWAEANRPDLRLAVNERKHFDLVAAVFQRLLPKGKNFGIIEAIRECDRVGGAS